MIVVSTLLGIFRTTREITDSHEREVSILDEPNRFIFDNIRPRSDEANGDAIEYYCARIGGISPFGFIDSQLSFEALRNADKYGIVHVGWDKFRGLLRPTFTRVGSIKGVVV